MKRLGARGLAARVEDAVRTILAHLQCANSELIAPDVPRLGTFLAPLSGENSIALVLKKPGPKGTQFK